ncbi:MAG: type II secretion system protein [Myxococcales bacterium]|nr:type II secretion system protein [Myxococcales bacterium]
MSSPGKRRRLTGFTTIELVIVIALMGIVAIGLSRLIALPFSTYRDLSLRAQLVDFADASIRRIARDLRRALPNSIRVAGSAETIEFIRALDGARYRRDPGDNGGGNDHTAASDWLSFGGDTDFNILGSFAHLRFTLGTPLSSGHRIAIYSTGSEIYTDAATDANPGTVTPDETDITITQDGDEQQINLSTSHQFSYESPVQRLYVVDTPVTYDCDLSGNTLTRYWSYPIASSQPTDPSSPPLLGATSSLMNNLIESCSFDYAPGTPQRAGLVTIELVVANGGERVRVLHQVHVDNSP